MTGGLGTACHGLVKSLVAQGVDVSFVIPSRDVEDPDDDGTESAVSAESNGFPETGTVRRGLFRLTRVPPSLNPYAGGPKPIILSNGDTLFQEGYDQDLYGGDLLAAVDKLALQARTIAAKQNFDVIHAHDWMTFPAGLAAREVSGKPLVIHLHSIEYDASTGSGRRLWTSNGGDSSERTVSSPSRHAANGWSWTSTASRRKRSPSSTTA